MYSALLVIASNWNSCAASYLFPPSKICKRFAILFQRYDYEHVPVSQGACGIMNGTENKMIVSLDLILTS